jgi:ferric-dicitrate binding protein FerR (iron transport regulator)
VKTLAIRLEEDQHAQLGMIAQLEELTVTDAIRQAIEQWIEARRSNPQLQARAEAVLADIDRDAATRRDAIATLLGSSAPTKRRGSSGGPKVPQAGLAKEAPSIVGYL